MLTVELLKSMATPVDWLRGLGYARNGRVSVLETGTDAGLGTEPDTGSGTEPDAVLDSEPDAVLESGLDAGLKSEPGAQLDSNPAAKLLVSGVVNTADRYLVSLVVSENQLLQAQCPCRHGASSICRHAVAVGLMYLHQKSDLEAGELLASEPPRVPLKKSPLDLSHHQVHILLHWHPLIEQVRVIPRIVWKDMEDRNLLRTHPLTPVPVQKHAIREHPATREVIDFFRQWSDWKADEIGCLTLPREYGLSMLFHDIAPLFPADWVTLYDEELEKRRPQRLEMAVKIKMADIQTSGLLLFSVSYHCNKLNITPEQLESLILGQQMWLIDQGRYIEISNLDQIRRLLNLIGETAGPNADDGTIAMEAWRTAELAEWAQEQRSGAINFDGALRRLLNGINRNDAPTGNDSPEDRFPMPPLPERLEAILRPYQKEGVRWLQFLRTYGLGGILADDMGLGKTIQVLAFLAANPHMRPSLIVCPKTLMVNWLHEAKRFAPELKTLLIHGSKSNRKHQFRQSEDCDLVITSYPLFQRDLDRFLGMAFDTCILDEAQMIKNPDTHLARQLKRVKADHRLVLTGTPMENTPVDLWSLFDFVMPGFLGTEADFRLRHTGPESSTEDLVRRIRPFLLRRTKGDVLPELPAKLEETLYAELTQNQLALYRHTLSHIKSRMRETLAAKGLGQAKIEVLAGLTRLRQICNHPGVIYPKYRSGSGLSGKMDLFELLLEQCLSSGHKVLVFSQFTQTLAIIAEKLVHQKLKYSLLDGQTSGRQAIVDQFNRDDEIKVFLISLKAGGYGLNLTSADTVILFDPWWNPMVEDQAADRAHRMGQSRPVTVYRLITQGTLEEKMVLLQERKRRSFNAVVNGAIVGHETISLADLQYLLEDGA